MRDYRGNDSQKGIAPRRLREGKEERLVVCFLGALSFLGCPKTPQITGAQDAGCDCARVTAEPEADPPAGAHRPDAILPTCREEGELPLEAARRYMERGNLARALACASKAAALDPSDALAQLARAEALASLGRREQARLAYARALSSTSDALDPLAAAARYYIVGSGEDHEALALGLTYAEQGLGRAVVQEDREMALTFAALAARAHNDLGQSDRALERAEWVLARAPKQEDARYERAVALFELCEFERAEAAFRELSHVPRDAAYAQNYLGQILERKGERGGAEMAFAKARSLKPSEFTSGVLLEPQEFKAQVQRAQAELPSEMRRDLRQVQIAVEDLPNANDLHAVDPPLSPGILGLFRGPPLGEACPAPANPHGTCRTIVLFRRNLGRSVRSRAELNEQIVTTLFHEVGHLRGEGDAELASRGLE